MVAQCIASNTTCVMRPKACIDSCTHTHAFTLGHTKPMGRLGNNPRVAFQRGVSGGESRPDMPPRDSASWPSTASRPPLSTGRGSKMSRWGDPPGILWASSCLPLALLMLPSEGPEHSTACQLFQLPLVLCRSLPKSPHRCCTALGFPLLSCFRVWCHP